MYQTYVKKMSATWKACQNLSSSNVSSMHYLTNIPGGKIDIKTLEWICMRRIRALYYLEKLSLSQDEYSTLWYTSASKNLRFKFPEMYNVCTNKGISMRDLKLRHLDNISRFVLLHSLYCNKEYIDVDWLLRNEIRLFRIYFLHLPICEQIKFVEDNKLANKLNNELYEVSWEYVLPLVKERSVELFRGNAHIKPCHFSIIASAFQKDNISALLSKIKRGFSTVKLDNRFYDIVVDLRKYLERYMNKSQLSDLLSDINTDNVNLTNLDDLSVFFPPCMERMYQHIENKHHLRFNGRLQFIPFLKDIGFSIHDTLQYFKFHFRQIMSDKQYASEKYEYFIRHQYGLEGRRLQYHTMNCLHMKDKSAEALSDCHGCPLLSNTNTKNILSSPNYADMKCEDKRYIESLVGTIPHNKICAKILSMRLSKNINNDDLIAINNPIKYYVMHQDLIANPFDDPI